MIRGLGLRGAVAVNMITMIGIGPLVTIPLVLASIHGGAALGAWILGAVIALCDGLVWAELASRLPGSGGTYRYLREGFGAAGAGRMASFLFVWQFVVAAPLLLASGYIGFAQYAAYLWPWLGAHALAQSALASAVGLVTIVVLFRDIVRVGRLSVALWIVALLTLVLVSLAGFVHFDPARLAIVHDASTGGGALVWGLGAALVVTLYDYAGYGDVCFVADEVRAPVRTIPRAVTLSILATAALYLVLQVAVLGAVDWHTLVNTTPGGAAPDDAGFVASTVVERAWGVPAARVATVLVLVVAFASTFGNLLGMSRIPYAAALDGAFFGSFARLHPTGRFPVVALLTIGLVAVPLTFVPLGTVIAALTAALVLAQSLAQIAALVLLRRRGAAPYRMWLYPVPAIVAAAGWVYIFLSSGAQAILFGLGSLVLGGGAYLVRAARRRDWPYGRRARATAVVLACAALLPLAARAAKPPAAVAGTVVEDHGHPEFRVAGKPFFMYGAAFFYDRIPATDWDAAMSDLRADGFDTLDLYVPWNWHEIADGEFDFDGRTNARRDLRRVLRLARAHGFYLIVRPGPVIRNEWRNGGYPAWLLERPAYAMPLRDVLEGRYPATATLQNAHSDDAARDWLRNATHMRYARRWLDHALGEFVPYADRVLAVALDDDQGAYIDNQTWPAPHLRAYLEALRADAVSTLGPATPTFINTYQMKVPASSPVWTMGNWYQSDAYALGEHDHAQLAFSTALLETRPQQPLWTSEFQAGWLLQPGEIVPQAAAPRNTELALGWMLQSGVRGVVDFPPEDTLAPAGYEAPFSNASYAWDAALTYPGASGGSRAAPRNEPTARFGAIVRRYGSALAATHLATDAAIAWLGSAYDPSSMTNADFGALADRTIETQQACRAAGLTCRLVDLRFDSTSDLARAGLVLLPVPHDGPLAGRAFAGAVRERLRRLASGGLRIATLVHDAHVDAPGLCALFDATGRAPILDGVPEATVALSNARDDSGFVTIVNPTETDRSYPDVVLRLPGRAPLRLAPIVAPAGRTTVVPFGVVASDESPEPQASLPPGTTYAPLPACATCVPLDRVVAVPAPQLLPVPADRATATMTDLYQDGLPVVVLQNDLVRIVVSPHAGGRAFAFQDLARGTSAFDSVGALRDDVAPQPPLSTSDRIARYTHQFPAGFFNRDYRATIESTGARAVVRLAYDAPDAFPSGAAFERTLTLEPHSRELVVDERAVFAAGTPPESHGVSISSVAVGDPRGTASPSVLSSGGPGAAGLFDAETHEAVVAAGTDGVTATTTPHTLDLAFRLARDAPTKIIFCYVHLADRAAAERLAAALPRDLATGSDRRDGKGVCTDARI